jgi:hypothetical protein
MRLSRPAPIMRPVIEGSSTHRIVEELQPGWLEQWIATGIEAVEEYLAKHAAFLAFLGEDAAVA